MFGITVLSINFRTKVDLPTLTGPTTPRYMFPPVRCDISL